MGFPIVTAQYPEGATSVIGTHDGRFHCDDALAVSLLRRLPEYADATVMRTRKPELLEKATIVVDVGGTFDPEKQRFDHHQRGFEETFDDKHKNTKLSSAGLVWKFFGKRLLEPFLAENDRVPDIINKMHVRMYESFFEAIDGLDNGVNMCSCGRTQNYSITTDLTTRVARINKEWNEWTENYDDREDFIKAAELAGSEFEVILTGLIKAWLPCLSIVRDAFNSRKEYHPSGLVIRLTQGCPFEEHLFEAEKDAGIEAPEEPDSPLPDNAILFCVYPSDSTVLRVKAISYRKKRFVSRLALPEQLRGVPKPDELSKIATLHFVHHSGFLAGVKSDEDAKKLIDMTLEMRNK